MKRVLIIGAGSIAWRHAKQMKLTAGLLCTGVCDPVEARAAALASELRCQSFVSPEEAIEKTDADYALILTPRRIRKELIELCAEHSLPFLVEKPPCDSMEAGLQIAELLDRKPTLHMVGFMHRWHESLNIVMDGMAGEKLSAITVRYVAPFATAPVFDKYPDPYIVERSGGIVGDQGIHYVDIARYISRSEVAHIACDSANQILKRSPVVTTSDAACWILRMKNDVMVSHCHTWCGASWACEISIVSDRSNVCVDMFANRASGTLAGKAFTFCGSNDEFMLEHRGMLRALETGDNSVVRSVFRDALESFRVSEEINRMLQPSP